MRAWRLTAGAKLIDDSRLAETDVPKADPGEVLIRVRACSLDHRDQMIAKGQYLGGPIEKEITPLSDSAGEVSAVGQGSPAFTLATGWQARVSRTGAMARRVPMLFPRSERRSLAEGLLAEYVALPEAGVVRIATASRSSRRRRCHALA